MLQLIVSVSKNTHCLSAPAFVSEHLWEQLYYRGTLMNDSLNDCGVGIYSFVPETDIFEQKCLLFFFYYLF